MQRNPVETILGAVVIAVAALFLAFAYTTADLGTVEGYQITAKFTKVGGLSSGSDVRVNGIKVGTVTGLSLDPDTFEAVVTLNVVSHMVLPQSTRASIVSDGLLGGKYVKLTPGRDSEEQLADGALLAQTQDYQSLEELVGEIIFLATESPTAASES